MQRTSNTHSHLFTFCRLVYLELRSDSFQRYLNSQMFASFLKKKGDMFFKTISIDTKLEEEITPGDFESPYITDKDIYFLVRLVWDVFNTTNM